MNRNRFRQLVFTLCGFLSAAVLAAADPDPKGILTFSVKVLEENASLYSSPDQETSYQTGYLHAGDLVEVCFRTENGWCALRPPEGSFSWVNGDYVLRSGSEIGTIICPDKSKEVPVRIGADSITRSTDVQVGLQSGRQVRILGEQILTGNKKWLKIAPPRGEFRWIHEKSLEKDDSFARIPNRLTRYEELLAQTEFPVTIPNPEESSRLQEEIIDSSQMNTHNPIRNVSFDNGFNRELSGIYSDLFTAIERSGSKDVFDLLAKRASVLASLAQDEHQKEEARKVSEKIESQRNASFAAGARITPNAAPLTDTQTFYHFAPTAANQAILPQNGTVRQAEPEPVLFALPNAAPAPVKTASRETKPNKIRFAFAPKSNSASSDNKGENRGIFSGKPSAIVPPANYTYPAPAMLKIAPETDSKTSNNRQSESQPAAAPQRTDQTSEAKMFLAEDNTADQNNPPHEIRQVSAYFVKPEINTAGSPPAAPISQPMAGTSPAQLGTPHFKPVQGESASVPASFGAMGTLGFLPNSTNGAPPYAIVSRNGNQVSILCYVMPQQGKSLDPFVGKKVGIDGTRGWFNKGGENRKMIAAERVQVLQ